MNYLTQSQKHRKTLNNILNTIGNNNVTGEFQGIYNDEFGNIYKLSERSDDYPDFYLDNSTYNKLKRLKKPRAEAYYIVVFKEEAYVFNINKHKYECHSQFLNKNTLEKKTKTVKKVREFHKWQREQLVNFAQIKTTILPVTPKKLTGLFQ